MKQNESVWNRPGIYGMIKRVTDVLMTLAMLFCAQEISGKTAIRNLLPDVFSPWPYGFLLWAGGIDQEELSCLFAVKE